MIDSLESKAQERRTSSKGESREPNTGTRTENHQPPRSAYMMKCLSMLGWLEDGELVRA